MKTISKILAIIFLMTATSGCLEEGISPLTDPTSTYGESASLSADKIQNKIKQSKVTGLVQIVWKGGKGMDNGNQPEEMLAFAGFEGFQGNSQFDVKGNFIYQVTTLDSTVHREIIAQLTGVYIDKDIGKSWLVGTITSDTKGCAGNGQGGHDLDCQGGSCGGHDPGGHDGGCSGGDGDDHSDGGCSNPDHDDSSHTDGGCSDSDQTDGGCSNPDHTDSDHTDGGCSGSDQTDGGCSNPDHSDTDHSSGGCSDSDHTDGGCSNPDHSDGDHTDGGCSGSDHGSGGDPGSGNTVKGKNCRVGQIIAIKCHDGGTPGADGDGITWKWFSAGGSFVPEIANRPDWPHLCKKNILEGNIVIHK